ncbi:MAG: lamin tail domain-containing protein, partial [Bacteroidota bacterium]
MRKLIFIALALFFSKQIEGQNLFINEVIASNDFGQMDVAFEYDDWIEIYNSGGILNLAGYYLSDDPLNLTMYQIPATNPGITTILPGGYLIFWADKDNLTQGENHTNFSLSANGETVFLTAPDGITIIDQLTYPQMATDISYGRSCDGCATLQYFNNVTYSATNFETPPASELLFINE